MTGKLAMFYVNICIKLVIEYATVFISLQNQGKLNLYSERENSVAGLVTLLLKSGNKRIFLEKRRL